MNPSQFRWSRTLSASSGSGPIAFDADASLFAHAESGFTGLRIVDADGAQVPWRPFPQSTASAPRRVPLLNAGTNGGAAVALLDLGPHAGVHDRIDLDLPGKGFVGTVTVSGSDDRQTFTLLGSTRIFDLAGAGGRVRSTVVTFPASDFRYLQLRATGVARIDGATVSGRSPASDVRPIPATRRGNVLDLGGAHVAVDAIRISSSTARYDRNVTIDARNPGGPWTRVATGRIYRLYGTPSPPIELAVQAGLLRVVIRNGDDPPLAGVHVQVLARPRTILVEGGHHEPLRILFGGRSRSAPSYEFARLPRGTLDLGQLRRGTLGAPELNASFERAPDTRSWMKRHSIVVDAALALVAAIVGFAGFLALRRRV